MATQYPIHPDDLEQLMRIRRYLVGFRVTEGWNQPTLSQKINGTSGMAYDLESNKTRQWRFSRLQDWTTPFGMRLTARLTYADDPCFEEEIHEHPEVAPVYRLSLDPSGAWKMWQRTYLSSVLAVARLGKGITSEQLGATMRLSPRAVSNWETSANQILLAKMLLHARVLGGVVRLEIVHDGPKPGDGLQTQVPDVTGKDLDRMGLTGEDVERIVAQVEKPRANLGSSGPPGRVD